MQRLFKRAQNHLGRCDFGTVVTATNKIYVRSRIDWNAIQRRLKLTMISILFFISPC